jgi:putative spermidine/putrescine transport system permease protein
MSITAATDDRTLQQVPEAQPKSRSRWFMHSAYGFGVAALAVFILGPVLILLVSAFALEWYYPSLVPQVWSLQWWGTILHGAHFLHAIALSFTFAPVVTLVSAAICLPAAYAFARVDFPGKRAMMMVIFATNAFPKMGLYIAMAGLFYAFNLMGTFPGVVIVQLLNTLVTMTWIPAASFSAVPRSLEEAARDVGASRWKTFWKVTFPLARPGIVVAAILTFLSSLDEAQGTFLIGAPKYITMPVKMYTLVSSYPAAASAVFAILLTLPSLVLLLFIRKYLFSETLASGYRLR